MPTLNRAPNEKELEKLEAETGLFGSITDEEIKSNAGKTYQDVTALRDPLAGLGLGEPQEEASPFEGAAQDAALYAADRKPDYIQLKNGKMNGSRPSGGKSGLTSGGENATMQSSLSVSATGANRFEKGFTEKNLDRHWQGGSSDHSAEYPGWTKKQYADRALELVQSPTDGKDILGYRTSRGAVVRYDVRTNDFVKGYPKTGIATMFKPKRGKGYFEMHMELEGESQE